MSALIRFGGEAFNRPATWLGENLQIVWMGWRRWRPFVAFERVRASNPLATVWRWRCFVGPLEIRLWVPAESAGSRASLDVEGGGK